MKNKYIYRSRVSEKKFREILRLFCIDIEAAKIAEITGVSRFTVNKFFQKIRNLIADICEKEFPIEKGEVELDESFFGPKRQRVKRGRGAANKICVFGILHRGGNVFTQIISECSHSEIMPIIEQRINKKCTVYTDGLNLYDALNERGYKKHFRVIHSNNEFANGRNHINGLESF